MTSFDEDRVMMRSSKEDRSWCASCLVGDFTNCVKEVESRSSANLLSIVSGEVTQKTRHTILFAVFFLLHITVQMHHRFTRINVFFKAKYNL